MIVRDHEKRRTAERFERRHFVFVERDRAPDDESRIVQANDCHPPREASQRHPNAADNRQDAGVDLGELAVRQDLPMLEWTRHRISSSEWWPRNSAVARASYAS